MKKPEIGASGGKPEIGGKAEQMKKKHAEKKRERSSTALKGRNGRSVAPRLQTMMPARGKGRNIGIVAPRLQTMM